MNDLELKTADQIIEKEFDIDAYLAKRSEFIEKVNRIMVEKQDYHVIQGKKSLGKGGAEKIAAIFGWQAMFLPDDDTIKMLGTDKGVVAYICRLTKGSQFVGEGRGARILTQDKGDINKAIKMAAKSAFVDSILRSSGLSDFFSQDLEDMRFNDGQTTPTSTKSTEPLKSPNFAPRVASVVAEPTKEQLNLVGTIFESYMKNVTEAKTLDELKGYWENVKYLGHTIGAGQKALIRSAIRQRQTEVEKK